MAQLKRDILPVALTQSPVNRTVLNTRLGSIITAFPDNNFPISAIHEFILSGPEDMSATTGFISGLLASLMPDTGVSIWISSKNAIFPPALRSFGIKPDKIIFIRLRKEKEILWAMEEALKCKGLTAVIAEVSDLHFTASRRLQLAVEKSQVTGFILHHDPKTLQTTACNTRWKIKSLPGQIKNKMPGVGHPCWHIELLKVRNGSPGNWQIEFVAGQFRQISQMAALTPELRKKTG
ncbi:MAG: Error-prone repair protein ImuA [Ferruginibacter sp.]